MKIQKIISIIIISAFSLSIVSAETLDINPNTIISELQNLISKLSTTITQLQNENTKLRNDIEELNKKFNSTNTVSSPAIVVTQETKPSIPTTNVSNEEKHNKVIDKINSIAAKIFQDNNLSESSSIWLFEFIEPSNFFISIDDWMNPSWVTAFKKKILYYYDDEINLNIKWIFELDYNSQYYITRNGSNPFSKTPRIRIKNPTYKWKLLDIDTNTTSSVDSNNSTSSLNSSISNTTTATTINSEVTIELIKAAYNKNKVSDALKLSNEYIKKDPNNIEVAKIRYRSMYLLGKYNDSLSEVSKIESILWNKIERTILCEAKTIAKLAKNNDLIKKYTDLCAASK